MKPAHLVKDTGGLALYGLGPRVVQRMSRRQMVLLSKALGDAVRRASPADVRAMHQELEQTLGPAAAHPDVIKRSFRMRMMNELEVLRYPTLDATNVDRTVVVEGRHHLDHALAQKKGAIVMIGHFGANQMIMPALGHNGYRMHQLSASPTAWLSIRTDGRVNRLFAQVQELRWQIEQSLPAELIDVFGFMRPAYVCLEKNEVLGLAFDGGGGTRWVPMRLGRRTAYVSTQPWQLARTTGAMVVPTVVVREPDEERHRVILSEPIAVSRTKDKEGDVAQAAQRYGQWFTGWLDRHPDHYVNFLLLRRNVRKTDNKPFFGDYVG